MVMKLQRNKLLSQLSVVNLKIYLPSKTKAYSEMCPINGTHERNNRTVGELEEEADCLSSATK